MVVYSLWNSRCACMARLLASPIFHSFKTRVGPADPGMGPVRVEVKTRLGIDPVDPGPGLKPVDFYFFLLKRRCFDFLKKKN